MTESPRHRAYRTLLAISLANVRGDGEARQAILVDFADNFAHPALATAFLMEAAFSVILAHLHIFAEKAGQSTEDFLQDLLLSEASHADEH